MHTVLTAFVHCQRLNLMIHWDAINYWNALHVNRRANDEKPANTLHTRLIWTASFRLGCTFLVILGWLIYFSASEVCYLQSETRENGSSEQISKLTVWLLERSLLSILKWLCNFQPTRSVVYRVKILGACLLTVPTSRVLIYCLSAPLAYIRYRVIVLTLQMSAPSSTSGSIALALGPSAPSSLTDLYNPYADTGGLLSYAHEKWRMFSFFGVRKHLIFNGMCM
jgi:hypothetical protein